MKFQGKTAFQAVASPLFLSTVPSKEGHVHVASRTATENEMVNVSKDFINSDRKDV